MDGNMTTYMAALTLYENNMRIIHWKLAGSEFHTTHERYGDYYEELGKYMDETAEQMITCGLPPVNSSEALNHMQSADFDAFTLSGTMDFDKQTAELAAFLADDSSLPVDVQDVFMGHAKYYRIEGLYKLGRRIKATEGPQD